MCIHTQVKSSSCYFCQQSKQTTGSRESVKLTSTRALKGMSKIAFQIPLPVQTTPPLTVAEA